MKNKLKPDDLSLKPLNLKVKAHIIQDLQEMEKNTGHSIDDLAMKALQMFIATHSDYLKKNDK